MLFFLQLKSFWRRDVFPLINNVDSNDHTFLLLFQLEGSSVCLEF